MKIFMSPHSKHKFLGYTLIELMVVIGILAVLAAIGIGNHRRNLARTQVRQEMEQLCGALHDVPPLARSAGDLVVNGTTRPKASNSQYNQGVNNFSKLFGNSECFVWRVYNGRTPDGKSRVVNKGFVGSYDQVALFATSGLVRAARGGAGITDPQKQITKGVWVEFIEADKQTKAAKTGGSSFFILFKPDGTPYVDGKIQVKHYEKASTPRIGVEITIDRMGNMNEKQIRS
ncbi:MAG: Tfp pilus assembly protein FimT/FimU [Candidatus Bruticola sp.]